MTQASHPWHQSFENASKALVHPEERSCFIWSTVKYLCHEPRFWHQWRTANHLATLCHKWFTIPKLLQFNGKDLHNALQKDPALQLDMEAEKSAQNQFGIYDDTYWPRDASSRRRGNHCYYLCHPDGNECVSSPPVGKAWYDTIRQSSDEIQAREHATRNKDSFLLMWLTWFARQRHLSRREIN